MIYLNQHEKIGKMLKSLNDELVGAACEVKSKDRKQYSKALKCLSGLRSSLEEIMFQNYKEATVKIYYSGIATSLNKELLIILTS